MARGWMFHKADTDGDGQISQHEWQAAGAKYWADRKAFVAKHNPDGDGTLNEAGRAAVKEQIKDRLAYSRSVGNDLTTPLPEFQFPGLRPGNRWCVCLSRWVEALETGPPSGR
jgi:hypothetical protein